MLIRVSPLLRLDVSFRQTSELLNLESSVLELVEIIVHADIVRT
jgi:hypothetical protein